MILQPEEDGILRYMGYYCCFSFSGGNIESCDIFKFFPDFTVTFLRCGLSADGQFHLPKYTALNPASKDTVSGRWTLMGHNVYIEYRKLFSSKTYSGVINGDRLSIQMNGGEFSFRFHNKFDIEHDLVHDERLDPT